MAGEYMKKTRDTLGKIIKKPPLTDKLLGKPPFRFLHDIFTEVIRTTGFLNGLFSSTEMDSKNVSVKEDKISFLQKVIDVVSIVSGEQLSTKPSKIVAGHEPDKTNELLQAIAKCVHKGASSDDAVQQVMSGKKSSKVQEKPPAGPSKRKEGKEIRPDEQKRKRRDKDDDKPERERSSDRRKRSAGKEGREKSKDKENTELGEGSDEKERQSSRDKSKDKERNKEDRSRDRRERKETKASKPKEASSTSKKILERKSSSSTKMPLKSTTADTKLNHSKQKTSQPADVGGKRNSERRRKKPQSKREEESRDRDESEGRKDAEDEEDKPQIDGQDETEETGEKPTGSRPPRPASAKGHRRRPTQDRGSRGNAAEGREASPKESRSRPARPPSARPAAPRVRQRPDAAEKEIARMESAGRQRTAPIIVDRGSRPAGEGISSSDDEDEQFLVQEEDVQPPEMGKLSPVFNGEVNGEAGEEGQHGGLVRKILETKKELETSAAKGANVTGKKRTEIERAPVNEVQRRKEREVVMRDIEKLRGSVQKLCRSAVPLGKIIDYIQEDMDSMQNELLQWKKENKDHAAKLKEEEGITTKTIEPMQAELEELDRTITAQLDMIAASKCNVIRNQEKIDKMVAGVTARS